MTLKIHPDKVKYFKDKATRAESELERKSKIESSDGTPIRRDMIKLEQMLQEKGGIEVFRGKITTRYYGVTNNEEGINYLSELFDLEISQLRFGSSGAFSRLREMIDDDGTKIYIIGTRIEKHLITEGTRLGSIDLEIIDTNPLHYRISAANNSHNSALTFREEEVKRRNCYILPGLEGVEYSIDIITEPEIVLPYIEIEISGSMIPETYDKAIQLIGLTMDDFVKESARTRIQKARERRLAIEAQST